MPFSSFLTQILVAASKKRFESIDVLRLLFPTTLFDWCTRLLIMYVPSKSNYTYHYHLLTVPVDGDRIVQCSTCPWITHFWLTGTRLWINGHRLSAFINWSQETKVVKFGLPSVWHLLESKGFSGFNVNLGNVVCLVGLGPRREIRRERWDETSRKAGPTVNHKPLLSSLILQIMAGDHVCP